MRPKDENQHGSMRPNLMSSARRGASEDNILAMLERDSARRGSSSRMAWYGTGSALALVLVGALAWLAYDSGALHEDQVLTPVAVAPRVAEPAGTAAAQAPRQAAIQPARAAAIVDTAPEPARPADAGAPPAKASVGEPAPLVLLSPDQAASIQAAAARAPTHAAGPQRAAPKAAPVRAAARKAAPKRGMASLAPVHKRIAAQRAVPRIRPAAHAPARRVAHPAGVARLKKAQPAAPPAAEAPVDSDVALISAIIGRSSRHAEERAEPRGERP